MKPIRPCMIWMDRRAQEETDWVLKNIGEEKLLEITTMEQTHTMDIRRFCG